MASVVDIITQVATQYGVAPWIALDIAQVESSLNPNAVGDNGTSFGLFQLHYGGQANGYTPSQLFDPYLNADIGIRNMVQGYQAGVAQGLSGYALLDYTATHSGHPSYAGVGSAPQYEAQLLNVYTQNQGNGGTGGQVSVPSQAGTPNGWTYTSTSGSGSGNKDALSILDDAFRIKNFDILHPLNSVMADAGAISLRIFVFLVALVIIIFGVYKVARG